MRRISAEKARAVREQAGMEVVIAADSGGDPGRGGAGQACGWLEAFKMLSTSPVAATRSIPALPSCGGSTPSQEETTPPSGS